MSHAEAVVIESGAPTRTPVWVNRNTPVAVLVAALATALGSFAIVMRTASAWHLLGMGRGLVPEEYYPYSGYAVVLATTLGQFVGWVASSAVLAYAWGRLVRRPVTPLMVHTAMIMAYLGLATVPLATYHLLFGQPLLGLERHGLEAWLAGAYPDAHALLYTAHPWVDLSLVPLGIAVVAILWRTRDERLGSLGIQLLLALLVMTTSLAVALSLAIHSVFIHLRF